MIVLRAMPVIRDTAAHAAASGRARLGRRKTTPAALVQHRIERLVAQLDGRLVNHAPSLVHFLIRAGIPANRKSHRDSVIYQQALSSTFRILAGWNVHAMTQKMSS